MLNRLKLKHIIAFIVILVIILLIISYGICAAKVMKTKSDYTSMPESEVTLGALDNEPLTGEDVDNNGANEEEQQSDRRPMVYVEDTLYFEIDYIKSLPEGADVIGNIEKVIAQSELPGENYTSNTAWAPIGSPVYADEDDLSVIYIERLDLEAGGYMKYVAESKLLSETSD